MSKAVFMIGFGGPESNDEVRPFLNKVLQGRAVTPERYEEVVRQYAAIGGASPYNSQTRTQAEKLKSRLESDGRPMPVYTAFRNAAPTIAEGLARMKADGVTEAAGVILSSYRSEPGWDRYVQAVDEARGAVPGAPDIRYLTPWNEDALFISAVADRLQETEASLSRHLRADAHWVFTAHSLPLAVEHECRYAEQLRRTVLRVTDRMDHANWTIGYQSRSGRPEDPWLEPDINEIIPSLNQARSLELIVIPVGFLTDHVEVLYDLDVKARGTAEAAGLTYLRAPTVGTHPSFLRLLSLRIAHALRLPVVQETF